MHNVKGAIVTPVRAIVANGVTIGSGRNAGIIAYPKSQSGKLYSRFLHFCAANGIHAEPVKSELRDDGRYDAFECIAPNVEPIAALIEREDFIAEWHFIFAIAPPRGGSGQGELTERGRKELRKHNPQRELESLSAVERADMFNRAECEANEAYPGR